MAALRVFNQFIITPRHPIICGNAIKKLVSAVFAANCFALIAFAESAHKIFPIFIKVQNTFRYIYENKTHSV